MNDSDQSRDPVERLAEDFVARCRQGEHPTVAEYAEAYPSWAEQIRQVFPTLLALEELKSDHQFCAGLTGQRAAEFEHPPERLGDFRILRTIGRGGMGVVYEAEQESLGRRVAIKVLAPSYASSSHALRRFRREAQAAARLHHTNIVSVFGVGTHEDKHFYVMQYIEGRSLDRVVAELSTRSLGDPAEGRKECEEHRCAGPERGRSGAAVARAMLRGRFEPVSPQPASAASQTDRKPEGDSREAMSGSTPSRSFSAQPGHGEALDTSDSLCGIGTRGTAYWRSVAGIGTQVAAALHYAHHQGILHRDVKPGNLILDEKGVAWITDFGLAKFVDQEDLTHPGDVVGTLRYMAPEQLEGKTSVRTDVYSLGLTLYELLTLRPAFDETIQHRLLRQVSGEAPPRPRAVNPGIPRDLETIVLKALAREPAHRYPTAGELADDLQRFLEDRPIRARRTSALEQGWRWCRRNPVMALLAATTLISLLAGAIGSSAGYMREASLRSQAELENRRAEANLAIAAEAFEDVFSRVSGTPLTHTFEETGGDVWGADVALPVVGRKDAVVLEGLLKYYDRFAEANRDNTRWQDQSGRAFRRVGDIQQRLGRFHEAEEAYGRAIEIYQRLARQTPEQVECVVELATVHNQLGNMALAADRFDEAFRHYAHSREILRDRPPAATSQPGRFQLAQAYRAAGLASLLQQIQSSSPESPATHAPDADACLLESLAILSELVAETPSRGEYRHALAECYGHLWGVCRFGQRAGEAAEARDKAITILEELIAEYPENPQYRQTLAWTCAVTSGFPLADQPGQTVASLEKALTLMGEVSPPHTEMPDYRRTLAYIYQGLAEAYFESGQDDRMEVSLEKSTELLEALNEEFPEIPHYRTGLGRSYYLRAVVEDGRGEPKLARQLLQQVIDLARTIDPQAASRSPPIGLLARTYWGLADIETRLGETALAAEAAAKARELFELDRIRPFKPPIGTRRDPWAQAPE